MKIGAGRRGRMWLDLSVFCYYFFCFRYTFLGVLFDIEVSFFFEIVRGVFVFFKVTEGFYKI